MLEADGYRFDMGPTILTLPSVLRRLFAEAGRRLEDALSLVPLDPQWRSFFDDGSTLDLCADVGEMGKRLDAFAPGGSADGYRAFLDLSAHLHDISDRYFFWRSIGSVWDMMDPRTMFKPSMLADLLRMRLGRSVAQTVRAFVPERARGPDARPFHAVRRLGPRRLAGRAVQHRSHADHGRRLVSRGRDRGRAAGAGPAGGRTRRGGPHRRGRPPHPAERGRRRGRRRDRKRRARAAGRGRLQRRRGADAPGAARRHGGVPPLRAPAALRAGLFRRRALPRSGPRLRPSGPPQLRFLARPGGGVRRHLPPRRAGPGPDLLRLRPGADGTGRRPARRRSALRSGPHALSAAAP